jgi:hypothetical protein
MASKVMASTLYTFLFALIYQGLALWAGVLIAYGILKPLRTFISKICVPALWLTAKVTPAEVPRCWHAFLAASWILVLRVCLYLQLGAYGLLPAVVS